MKNRKKPELPVSRGVPLKGINLKVYQNFSIVGCLFSLQMANFCPVPLNPAQEKNKITKFTPSNWLHFYHR